MWMVPRCCGPEVRPGHAMKSGSSERATLILTDALSYEMRSTAARKAGGRASGARSRRKVTCASALLATTDARNSSPPASAAPPPRPPRHRLPGTSASPRARRAPDAAAANQDPGDLGLAADLDAQIARGARECLGEPAHAAAHVAP